jgi:rod shape-determining protein MreC
MPAPSNTRQNVLLLVALLFVQLLLMSGSVKGTDGSTLLESWSIRLSSPVVALARAVGGGISGMASGIMDLLGAHSRNAALEAEIGELRAELRRARESSQENVRLRRLLGMREELGASAIAATVVTGKRSGDAEMIVISRGRDDGVAKDLPVVAWGGAVGRVVAVAEGHCKVRLLTDPNSGVGALLQRNREHGVVFGRGDDRLDLLYVPGFSDVGRGDRVVTSGMDGIFPRGFGIGQVETIEPQADGGLKIGLEPEVDYGSLEEVLILLEPPNGGLLAPWRGGEEGL